MCCGLVELPDFLHDYLDHCTTKQLYTPVLDKQIQNYSTHVSEVLKLCFAPCSFFIVATQEPTTCNASKSSRLEFEPQI